MGEYIRTKQIPKHLMQWQQESYNGNVPPIRWDWSDRNSDISYSTVRTWHIIMWILIEIPSGNIATIIGTVFLRLDMLYSMGKAPKYCVCQCGFSPPRPLTSIFILEHRYGESMGCIYAHSIGGLIIRITGKMTHPYQNGHTIQFRSVHNITSLVLPLRCSV